MQQTSTTKSRGHPTRQSSETIHASSGRVFNEHEPASQSADSIGERTPWIFGTTETSAPHWNRTPKHPSVRSKHST